MAMLLMLSFPLVCYSANKEIDNIRAIFSDNQHTQALQLINTYRNHNPKNLDAHFLQGVIQQSLGQLNSAEKTFLAISQNNPDLPEPYNNLAAIYALKGDFDRARKHLLKAIESHESYATAYSNLTAIYAQLASVAYSEALNMATQPASKMNLSMIDHLYSKEAENIAIAVLKKANRTAIPRVAPPISPNIADKNQVILALERWSEAWSQQNSELYLAAYSKDFQTPGTLSLKQWKKQRKSRIKSPSFIKVRVLNPKVTVLSQTSVSVVFSQHYRSNRFEDTVKKNLIMINKEGKWRIIQEYIIR